MNKCKAIARFMGATEFKLDSYGILLGYWPELDEGCGEGWREVHEYADKEEIAEWHDGLFEKIEEKGLREKFMAEWFGQWAERGGNGDDYSWDILSATPAQLTDALYEVLPDECK